MPYRIRQWWGYKTQLEKVLMAVIAIAIFIIIVLASVMKHDVQRKPPETCNTPPCLSEALKIMRYTDPKTNPCDDFYQYVCGNFNENSSDEENLSFSLLQKQQIVNICNEVVHPNDPEIIKLSKRLYQTCVSDTGVSTTSVDILKGVLKSAGGWPVVEGENWNEADFDWKKSSYKCRELGYYDEYFVRIDVDYAADNNSNNLLEVLVADVYDYRYGILKVDKAQVMMDVAAIFGANITAENLDELTQAHDFQQKLQQLVYYKPNKEDVHHKYSISEYQKLCNSIDWLDFINNMLGSKIQVPANQTALFPPPEIFQKWLDLIEKTPKRVQANYIMWKLVERMMPYLTWELRHFKQGLRKKQHQEEHCFDILGDMGLLYATQIMLNRRRVSVDKNRRLEDLMINMKVELIQSVNRSVIFNETNREKALNTLRALQFSTIPSEKPTGKDVLTELAVDMINHQKEEFLNLLAQATRNLLTLTYLALNTTGAVWKKSHINLPKYHKDGNIIYAHGLATHKMFFDEKRPNYVNYGNVGSILQYSFNTLLEQMLDTNRTLISTGKCLSKGTFKDDTKAILLAHLSIGQQIAYAGYQSWVRKYGKELPLVNVQHTPNQLFWISYASTYCHASTFHGNYLDQLLNPSEYIAYSMGNKLRFSRDFNCPASSKMYPTVKCDII